MLYKAKRELDLNAGALFKSKHVCGICGRLGSASNNEVPSFHAIVTLCVAIQVFWALATTATSKMFPKKQMNEMTSVIRDALFQAIMARDYTDIKVQIEASPYSCKCS